MVTINIFLNNIFAGIYFTLGIYHLFVWLGRKKDYSNLAFSLVSFSFLCYRVLLYAVDFGFPRLLANNIFTIFMITTLPFLVFSIGLTPMKFRNFVIIMSAGVSFLGIIASVLYYFSDGFALINHIFYIAVIAFATVGNLPGTLYFIKNKMYRKRQLFLFYIGFGVLLTGILTAFIIFAFLGIAQNHPVAPLLLNLPFTAMMIIFAFALTSNFNREHRELEILKINLEKKVLERTAQLEAATRQKTNFFVNIAHEMRTPLTLISNYFKQYVEKNKESQESRIIANNIEKLRRDMLHFLDLEKIEKGQVFYDNNQIVNASEFVTNQVILFDQLAQSQNIRFSAKIDSGIFLKIDPFAFERIVNNLLENAIKYNEENGLIEVIFSSAAENNSIFQVLNTGRRIPADQQKHIFDPYYQVSRRKQNIQGVGMGLAIVNKIISDAGGSIQHKMTADEKNCFEVTLPRTEESDAISFTPHSSRQLRPLIAEQIRIAEKENDAGKQTLFIVEDNRELLLFLTDKFSGKYNVVFAADGREALDKLESHQLPDCILSDIMMDTMNGFEFRDKLVEEERFREIPFVFLTALSASKDKIKGLRKGAVDFIHKPFDIDELKTKIDSWMSIRRALSQQNLDHLGHQLYAQLQNTGTAQGQSGPPAAGKDQVRAVLGKEYGISDRQMEILALLKTGLLRKEICFQLEITPNTLNTQMTRMFKKCGVSNKTELINIFR
ncbi:MAG: response regulator [Spirochaetales bacterium]|nr:response regulator [Spirochaetales bacterium]